MIQLSSAQRQQLIVRQGYECKLRSPRVLLLCHHPHSLPPCSDFGLLWTSYQIGLHFRLVRSLTTYLVRIVLQPRAFHCRYFQVSRTTHLKCKAEHATFYAAPGWLVSEVSPHIPTGNGKVDRTLIVAHGRI